MLWGDSLNNKMRLKGWMLGGASITTPQWKRSHVICHMLQSSLTLTFVLLVVNETGMSSGCKWVANNRLDGVSAAICKGKRKTNMEDKVLVEKWVWLVRECKEMLKRKYLTANIPRLEYKHKQNMHLKFLSHTSHSNSLDFQPPKWQ